MFQDLLFVATAVAFFVVIDRIVGWIDERGSDSRG